MIPTPIRRIVYAAFTLLAILALCLFLVVCHAREQAKDARVNETKAEARTESAVVAITEIGKLNERGQVSDQQVREAQDAILQAAPADRDAIARRELERLQHNGP